MLLETFETDGSSIIVFSRNNINGDENFRLVLKNDPKKLSRKLYLYDICGLISKKVHKNLIVYRLLTNIENLSLINSRWGCFIKTTNGAELIYPDPVYAVKELEDLSSEEYIPGLKFRIQQVGYTGAVAEDEVIYSELFSFDLDSEQANVQNDTVFVEAMLKDEKRFETYNEFVQKPEFAETKDASGEKTVNPFPRKIKDITFKALFERLEKQKLPFQSSIGVFHSPASMNEYLKEKKKRKTILEFLKK